MQCKLCKAQVGQPTYRLDNFTVLTCPACSVVFADLEPTRDELKELYSFPYFLQR